MDVKKGQKPCIYWVIWPSLELLGTVLCGDGRDRTADLLIANQKRRCFTLMSLLQNSPMSRVDVASRALGERENGLVGVIGGGVLCEWHDFPGVGRDCSCKSVA